MYLLIVILSLCLSYLLLHYLFPLFFNLKIAKIGKRAIYSIAVIALFCLFDYLLVSSISDIEIGNRILHGFGGGFIAFLVCFLVVNDNKLKISKLQFFIFSLLLVSTLGVANEIVEFFMQNYFGQLMAPNINDTWLDLISNTLGILIGGIIFTPFINRQKSTPV